MSYKVLVVDDSQFFLNVMSDKLTSLNYEVKVAHDSRAALKDVEANRYDLIFTDLNMPGLDGIEFAEQIKLIEHCRFVPIVMLSGDNNEDRINQAKRKGVSLFLSKPVNETRLQSLLQVVFGKENLPEQDDNKNPGFTTRYGKEIFELNFSTESQQEILALIEETATLIRQRPEKSVLGLTVVSKGMFTNQIMEALKDLVKGNDPYVRKSAVVGVTGVYKVAMNTLRMFSKREFKLCSTKEEAIEYLIND